MSLPYPWFTAHSCGSPLLSFIWSSKINLWKLPPQKNFVHLPGQQTLYGYIDKIATEGIYHNSFYLKRIALAFKRSAVM
jgi:hypothetical protein